ncbi:MAG TPA: helix-turn-helix domain-containing protein [Bryobacteraceae bacterium]|nr:helix-turn-helix domain-containing protein [Bryobacteraceae bacterium]
MVSANLSDEGLPAAILDLAANKTILMFVSPALGGLKGPASAALCIPEERVGRSDPEAGGATRQGSQGGVQKMKPKMLEELLESVREGGAVLRGQREASRRFEVGSSGIRAIRERTSLSQSEFARLIGVSVKTLQNWEQDRRRPTGPAATLLRIIAYEPRLAVKAIHHT